MVRNTWYRMYIDALQIAGKTHVLLSTCTEYSLTIAMRLHAALYTVVRTQSRPLRISSMPRTAYVQSVNSSCESLSGLNSWPDRIMDTDTPVSYLGYHL